MFKVTACNASHDLAIVEALYLNSAR